MRGRFFVGLSSPYQDPRYCFESFSMTFSLPNPVEVRVDFHGTRVLPRAMLWNKHAYPFTVVQMITPLKDGEIMLYDFSVTDGENYFRLRFNTALLSWALIEMSLQKENL